MFVWEVVLLATDVSQDKRFDEPADAVLSWPERLWALARRIGRPALPRADKGGHEREGNPTGWRPGSQLFHVWAPVIRYSSLAGSCRERTQPRTDMLSSRRVPYDETTPRKQSFRKVSRKIGMAADQASRKVACWQ